MPIAELLRPHVILPLDVANINCCFPKILVQVLDCDLLEVAPVLFLIVNAVAPRDPGIYCDLTKSVLQGGHQGRWLGGDIKKAPGERAALNFRNQGFHDLDAGIVGDGVRSPIL